MIRKGMQNVIIEHALKDEDSLRLTLDIFNSIDPLCDFVIRAFIPQLRQEAEREFTADSGWKVDSYIDPGKAYGTGIEVHKQIWNGRFKICISCGGKWGTEVYVEIYDEKKLPNDRPVGLLNALEDYRECPELDPKEKGTIYWNYPPEEYGNKTWEEMLFNWHFKRADSATQYLHLAKDIAKIAGPMIDKYIAKK